MGNSNLVRIVCIAIGVIFAMLLFRGVLGFSPIIGGALGGGVGVLIGYGLFAAYNKVRS